MSSFNVSFNLTEEQLTALEYLIQNINWDDLVRLSSEQESTLQMRGGLALLRIALRDAKNNAQ